MIIDLPAFINASRPYWEELDDLLTLLEGRGEQITPLQAFRLHELYERVLSDMAQITTFASENTTSAYLSDLASRAYAEIHETRTRRNRLRVNPWRWLRVTFPRTFRRHSRAFLLSVLITVGGGMIGGVAVLFDSDVKETILPFEHLLGSPSERVAREEATTRDYMAGRKASGSAWYMTHNTKVSILTLALGATYGIGTIILLFYNGLILGAVTVDYLAAGEGVFLTGWLLPHGSVEIPAILIAGQAGLVLATTLIGNRSRRPMRDRLRAIAPDLVTLAMGFALLLVWAGIIESCFSQHHEPAVPYAVKITFGSVQLTLLCIYLAIAGRKEVAPRRWHAPARLKALFDRIMKEDDIVADDTLR